MSYDKLLRLGGAGLPSWLTVSDDKLLRLGGVGLPSWLTVSDDKLLRPGGVGLWAYRVGIRRSTAAPGRSYSSRSSSRSGRCDSTGAGCTATWRQTPPSRTSSLSSRRTTTSGDLHLPTIDVVNHQHNSVVAYSLLTESLSIETIE